MTLVFVMACLCSALSSGAEPAARLVSRVVATNQPGVYGSVYAEAKGLRLLGRAAVSEDNGQTWSARELKPDFTRGLPKGYRREPITSVFDPATGRIITVLNAMNTAGLNPLAHEPPIAQQTYYLRYRVSDDGGRTWRFDEPIIQSGSFDAKHPINGVWVGTNAIYLGDTGCIPLVIESGEILLPTQMTPLGPDGSLWNPSGGHTFTDVLVLRGTWTTHGHVAWRISERVRGDPQRTTRGLIEPTLAEFSSGRILMVMRGSNGGKADPRQHLPSYKWFAISTDDGRTWSKPQPWTYEDGTPFFSPSSMCLLFKHSSGRVFWVGNISSENCKGDLPRWPLMMGVVNPKTLRLVRESLLVVDTEQPTDRTQGRLDISHVTAFEDRQTHEIVLSYPRAHNAYKSYEWITARLDVGKGLAVQRLNRR